MALLWCAGIIWFAMDVAGSPDNSTTKGASSAEQSQELTDAEKRALDKFLK